MRIQSRSGTSFVPSVLLRAALILALGSPVFGQGTGRVVGSVTEAATGGAVAGAQILIEGTGIGTVSGQRGTYSIANVPAGPQTLVVSVLGFETLRQEVDVAAGETATVDIALTAGYVEMGA